MNKKELMNHIASTTSLLYVLTDEETKRLKAILIEMYKDLAKLCSDNNLQLLLGGGSALGAVRHKGFIPWDDDIDLMMHRSDYDKLLTLLEKGAMGEKYEYSAPNPHTISNARFLKIYLRGTVCEEIGMSKIPCPKGIFLDVFPIVNVPNSKVKRFIYGNIANFLALMFSCTCQYKYTDELSKLFVNLSFKSRVMCAAMKTVGLFGSIIPCHKWAYYFDKFCASFPKEALIAVPAGRTHYFGEILPYSTHFPPSKGIFEGVEVKLSNDVEKYLTKLYGPTYMQLPPLEKRERHFVVKLDFGEYK